MAAGNIWPRAYTLIMWGQPDLVRRLITAVGADKAAVSNVRPDAPLVLQPDTNIRKITAGHDQNYLLKVCNLSDDLQNALLLLEVR